MVRHGVAGTTVAAVAEEAGVRPGLIRHYVGNRDDFIAAAVERALANVDEAVVQPVTDLDGRDLVETQLGLLFGGPLGAAEINQLVDQLVADSYLHAHTRAALAGLYARFQRHLLDVLGAAYPAAPTERRRRAATAVLSLAHAGATFDHLGFDEDSAADNRAAARALIEALLGPLPD